MSAQFPYPLELFDRFRNIHESDVYGVIRFYENHKEELNLMPFEERFIMLCYYSNALFAAEEYQQHLEYAQEVLEASIVGGVQYVDGFDVYLHTLSQKIDSHIHLKELDNAIKTCNQVLAISNNNSKKTLAQMKRALLLKRPIWVQKAFALAIFAMIIWTGAELLRMLVFEHFYPLVNTFVLFLQFTALPFAILIGLTAIFGHYFFVIIELQKAKQKFK